MALKIDGETFLRVKDVCEFLEVTPPTLTKYRKLGRIDGVKVGKRWIYSAQSVRHFLNGGGFVGGVVDPRTGARHHLEDLYD